MKGKRNNDINVEGSGEIKCNKWRKVRESVNIKKWFNIKKFIEKLKKKMIMNADVVQLKCNNNKCCISIYIYILAGCGTIGAQSGAETKGWLGGTAHTKLVPNPPFVSAHLEELPMWTCQTKGNMNHRTQTKPAQP